MITVSEIKRRRVEQAETTLNEIEQRILYAEERGKRFIQFNITKQIDTAIIFETLKSAGFKTSHHVGADIRGESWEYIHISWE